MSDLISTDSPFTEEQKQALAILVDMMIPANDVMPSAADPDIFSVILTYLVDTAEDMRKGIQALNGLSVEQHQKPFLALNEDAQGMIVSDFRVLHGEPIALLQMHTVSSYYMDDRVLEALGLEARPPFPGGYNVAPSDWSMLDSVRAREKLYRQV